MVSHKIDFRPIWTHESIPTPWELNKPELAVFTAFHDWSIISSAVTTAAIAITWRKRESVRVSSTTFVFFFKTTISRHTLIFTVKPVHNRNARFKFHQMFKNTVHEIHVTFTGHLSTRIVNFCRVITEKTLIWARKDIFENKNWNQHFWFQKSL